jgi:hypothetical protein
MMYAKNGLLMKRKNSRLFKSRNDKVMGLMKALSRERIVYANFNFCTIFL